MNHGGIIGASTSFGFRTGNASEGIHSMDTVHPSMADSKTLVIASVALSGALAAIAFLDANWMWFIINFLCVVMLVAPHVKNLGYRYRDKIVWTSMLAPILAVVVFFIKQWFPLETEMIMDVTIYTYITAAIQAYQCFLIGFMLSIMMDRSYGLTMTPTWMIVFALTFAMSLSALDMFFTVGEMYLTGYDVFNGEFYEKNLYTNGILMATPLTATVVTAIFAILWIKRLHNRDKNDLIVEGGSA